MKLFEVVFYGSNGSANNRDTIFLVRADCVSEAVRATLQLYHEHLGQTFPTPSVVYELGIDQAHFLAEAEPKVLRGPYIESAYNFGWTTWEYDEEQRAWKILTETY